MHISHALIFNLLHLTSQTEAFMPFDWRAAHLGAAGVSHKAMTKTAYEQLAKEFWPDIKKLTGTMIRARNTWALANSRVDEEITTPTAHCDGEDFEGCNGFILDLRQDVIDALKASRKNVLAAQESLGKSLHPLQDFYSHSNWIEMNGGAVVHPKLGMKLEYPNQIPIPNTDPAVSTCQLCSPHVYTGSEFICQALCLKGDGLINLYDQLAVANLSVPLGLASYILGGIQIFPSVVQRQYCMEDCTCHDCLKGVLTNVLTSGYSAEEWKKRPIPLKNGVFKCVHGGHSDALARTLEGKSGGLPYADPLFGEAYDGINKDSLDCSWSPLGPKWHRAAVEAATSATIKYVREIAAELSPLELKLLFGVGPAIAFVIDTTASMKKVIASVSSEIINVINHRIGTIDEPSLYILSEISNPATNATSVRSETDAQKFKAALLALQARGGSDCSAFSMSGAVNALNQLGTGADLFIITDSVVNDPQAAAEVTKLAQRKGVRIWPFIFSGCKSSSSPDPLIFERIARATQGQAFQNLSQSDAVRITQIADNLVRSNTVSILSSEINFFSTLSFMEEVFFDDMHLIDALIAINTFRSLAELTVKLADYYGIGIPGWLGSQPWKTKKNDSTPPTSWWKRSRGAIAKFENATANTTEETWSYFVPVDSSMEQLNIHISGHASISRILRPDGSSLSRTHPSIDLITLSDSAGPTIINIRKPTPGFYLVTLSIAGNFTISFTGVSSLHYTNFAFARLRGRPGHSGFDTIDGPPETGISTHPIIATLEGNVADCEFACCSPEGEMKANYTLMKGSGDYGQPGTNSHFGLMSVPSGPFFNYVYGFDRDGKPFQRVFSGGAVTPMVKGGSSAVATVLQTTKVTLQP